MVEVADLAVLRARQSMQQVGWPEERYSARSAGEALKTGGTFVSVLSAVLRGEPTGCSKEFRGDAVATAKRDMQPDEMLDGEGGFAVWANAIPASRSLSLRAPPIGLAHDVALKRAVKKNQIVSFDDVDLVNDLDVVKLRHEMEDRFRPA